ncbi:MAG: manganese efflux pump [Alphaproteobacteria bacterium]|nr:manganese efflux pump [Alphaproteobacteria bacterium]
MTFASNTVLAFSMSADAFAASVSKGVGMRKPRLVEALRIGAIFGIVETITPILGWLVGYAASGIITAIDHWIAFTILCIIGGKMVFESLQSDRPEAEAKSGKKGLALLVLMAVGTSIDAMAIGVTLAFLKVSIWIPALMIGGATFLMATLGIMLGHIIGAKAGRWVEAAGGLCLITIGSLILVEHLG